MRGWNDDEVSIVFEVADSGAVSAYVPGLPVYAAGGTADEAEKALRELLTLFVNDRRTRGIVLPEPQTAVKVARVTTARGRSTVAILSPAALLGRQRSARKAAAARRNGRRGGRPATTHRMR